MGVDISVKLLYGFKVKLSDVFNLGLLNPDILEGDAWQMLDEEGPIDEFVTSPALKSLLKKWNLYILSSTQNEHKPVDSYLFIYNRIETLCDEIVDYTTRQVDTNVDFAKEDLQAFKIILNNAILEYGIHVVIEGSW